MESSRTAKTAYGVDYKIRALLIFGLVLALSIAGRHFELDDALIYARYIAHALQGRGLEFNPGEPVNALTSILDTWLLLGLSYILRGNILLAQMILGGSFLFGAALLAESMVPLSGIFIAASSFFYFCNGMETSLFLFLLALCVRAYVAERVNWLPVLCVLTVLARFEGGAMLVVVAWQLWRKGRFPRLVYYVPAILLIVFYFAFNLHFYGTMLPQSASAKFGQGLSGNWGRWPTAFLRVPEMVYLPLAGSPNVYAPILMIFAAFGAADRRMARINETLIPFLVILGSFYVLFNIPGYHWYYGPFVFFFSFYALRLIPETRTAQWASLLALACLAGASVQYLHKAGVPKVDYARAGDWLSQNSAKNVRIASVETGTIGWHCDRYLIDIVGLTTPQNAHYTAKGDYSSWIAEKPDIIVVHPGNPFPWERVALASPDYEYLPVHFGDVYLLRRKSSS